MDSSFSMVPFLQFEKREKHPTLLKVKLFRGLFACFLYGKNDKKSHKSVSFV